MKFAKINLFLLCLVAFLSNANSEEDPAAKRVGLLQRRNIGGRPSPLNKAAASTTTTTVAPEEENLEGEEDYSEPEQEKLAEEVPTTTEAPRKVMRIRPFRSNDDLLAALKKRRLQSKVEKTVTEKARTEYQDAPKETPKVAEAKSPKATLAGKKRFGGPKAAGPKALVSENSPTEEPSPAAPSSERTARKFVLNRNKP